MGGLGSGQWGGRPTVEGSLTLDINRLLRHGSIHRDATTSGSLSWSYAHARPSASIGYRAVLGPERGHIRLCWTTTDRSTGELLQREQWIELTTTPQPLGGRRWWFTCPKRGDLVSKLHLPLGGALFASRKAHRLGYHSQRQSPRDRAVTQAHKLRGRLGAMGGIGDEIQKPRGMRWATFDRHMDRIEAAELVCNANLLRFVQQLDRHTK
jgi:hypothetical protein